MVKTIRGKLHPTLKPRLAMERTNTKKMAPWIGLHTADAPPLPKPPLITMITMSTNRAQPAVIAMTLKNPRALRAAATSRIGRTCSDIRYLSCLTEGSQHVVVVVVVGVVVVV